MSALDHMERDLYSIFEKGATFDTFEKHDELSSPKDGISIEELEIRWRVQVAADVKAWIAEEQKRCTAEGISHSNMTACPESTYG